MTPFKPGLVLAGGALVCIAGGVYPGSGLRLRAEPAAACPGGPSAAGVWRAVALASPQSQDAALRTVKLTAKRYRFDPPRIEVFVDDLVRIELQTEDIAHSLTIDTYRISKRVGPATPITFEFRADQAGTFPYYCNLQIDDGCRQMRGELIVKPRK